ncbi:MAG: hypothetical protein KDI44_12890 [Thiothrix sp.]|nr:hypothetical protein [Thiothrix sp.]HPQ96951.1 hypothetical protein [Thiolinea sp.]
MSIPSPQTAMAAPLSFESRLARVRAEVESRVSACPAADGNATRARLWVRWITRQLQGKAVQP